MSYIDLDSLELGHEYVYSRDVIELLDELDSAAEELRDTRDTARQRFVELDRQCIAAALEGTDSAPGTPGDPWPALDAERQAAHAEWQDACEALAAHEEQTEELRAFAEECEGYCADWKYGATLIPSDRFIDYAQQLAEGIAAYGADAAWPCNHIDWEAAAEELAIDYTTVTFRGTDYMVR